MKRILVLCFAAMLATQAWAEDTTFEVGDFGYTIIEGTSNVSVGRRPNKTISGAVDIPDKVTNPNNGKVYTVTSIRIHGFFDCSLLTSITIPNSVTSISSSAFIDCRSLKSVTIGNSVRTISAGAFRGCNSLTEFNVERANTIFASENGVLFDKRKTAIVCYPIGKTGTYTIPNSVTSIAEQAFAECCGLTSVTIPKSVTSIGNGAFSFVKNIIYSGNATGKPWGALTVNGVIDGDFIYSDNKKTNLTAYIGNDCDVVIPNSVTSIGNKAFYNCSSLKSVTIPNTVTSIGNNAFYLVKNIIYSGNATGTPWGALIVNGIIDGDFIYSDDTKTNLTAYIGDVDDVVIPNSVTSIGRFAFYNCSSMKSVIIPHSVTTICGFAFQDCCSLTTITIPNSVTSIGDQAFYLCSGLTSIAYDGGREPYISLNGTFAGTDYCSIIVCVPVGYSSTSFGGGLLNVCKGLVHDNATEPTCAEIGLTEGLHCSNCGKVFVAQEEISALGHNYGTPTYEWSEDNSTCTATKICANDNDHVVTETADASSAVTVAATCEAVGTRTFTAEFADEDFATQRTTEDIPATSHNYSAPTYEWGEGNSTCTATKVCANNSEHVVSETADATSTVTVAATCEAVGTRTFTADFTDEDFATQQTTEDIAATGHKEVVDAAVAATCTAAGKTEGKHCEVCNTVFVAQEDIPALGHDFKTYKFDNNATTEADGTETARCEHGCGTTDTRTAAGTKIATTPEKGTAVAESTANAVSIYTRNNIIVVENATAEIRVYDAMGRLICRDAINRVRTEIPVNTPGLYIVRVGNVAKRVMINE